MIISTVSKIRSFDEEHDGENDFEKVANNYKASIWWLIAAQSNYTIDSTLSSLPLT